MPTKDSLEYLASALLAVIAGSVNVWAAARFGESEKRYLIGGAASLSGIGVLLLYEFFSHRWEYLTGTYIIIVFLVQWLVRRHQLRNSGSRATRP